MNYTFVIRASDIFTPANVALSTILSLVIITINTFLLVSIWRLPSIRKHQNTVFLASLIVVHLLIGVSVFCQIPIMVLFNLPLSTVVKIYSVGGYQFRLLLSTGYSILLIMLFDRLIAVKKPFVYQQFTHRQFVMVLPLVLVIPIIYLILLLIDFKKFSVSCAFLYTCTGLILLSGNLAIFLDVNKQLKRIKSLTQVSTNKASGLTPINKDFKRKLRKSVLVSLLFTLSFFVFSIPFISVILKKLSEGMYTGGVSPGDDVMNVLWAIMMLNSLADPLIYVSLNRPVRSAILKILKCNLTGFKNESSKLISSKSRTSDVSLV